MADHDRNFSRDEVAGLLGVHPKRISSLLEQGFVPLEAGARMGKGARRTYPFSQAIEFLIAEHLLRAFPPPVVRVILQAIRTDQSIAEIYIDPQSGRHVVVSGTVWWLTVGGLNRHTVDDLKSYLNPELSGRPDFKKIKANLNPHFLGEFLDEQQQAQVTQGQRAPWDTVSDPVAVIKVRVAPPDWYGHRWIMLSDYLRQLSSHHLIWPTAYVLDFGQFYRLAEAWSQRLRNPIDVGAANQSMKTFSQRTEEDATMNELLTLDEAATLLRCKKDYLYKRTRNNAVPVVRIGRLLRFRRGDLLAWIAAQNPGSSPTEPPPAIA